VSEGWVSRAMLGARTECDISYSTEHCKLGFYQYVYRSVSVIHCTLSYSRSACQISLGLTRANLLGFSKWQKWAFTV
jgi:hypothetical protein